jgi:hypothetical protein
MLDEDDRDSASMLTVTCPRSSKTGVEAGLCLVCCGCSSPSNAEPFANANNHLGNEKALRCAILLFHVYIEQEDPTHSLNTAHA